MRAQIWPSSFAFAGSLFKQAVVEWHHLQTAQVSDVVGRHTVVVEEPPAAFVTDNAVMRGPTDYGLQELALEAERTVRIVTNGHAKQVAVTCGISKVVATIGLVHPRSLEEAMGV